MDESIERKVLKTMVGLWLEQRLKRLIHDKNKISKTLGVDTRMTKKLILSKLGEASKALGQSDIEPQTDDVAKVMIGLWIEGELANLAREAGRISKTMGIHGYEVKDFILSLLGEISKALIEAYHS